ncbi:Heavy metal sensor histidine kinase [Thioalkalivibrio nitratireducens DSM 14787]|uniref:Sensor protein n=1 Tax=Thioalkalivibrio nitratireducens (strain DSM 14787 / UNIQEM 213 / ALEN2) TaxID=1255043 RepID=L0DUV9_THIND|nr:heavy metal sensor histidine kinase [Thioalkalivibrio nitratireducens]AGA32780.1 Heavy metal sensor histidine kinase [Thioalkalivibrio nitratireducens DSM 14787]
MNRMTGGRLSLTARVALLFALFSAALLLLVGLVVERSVTRHFIELDEHELSAKLGVIGNLIGRTTSEAAFASLPQRLSDVLIGHELLEVRITDGGGRELYTTPGGFAPEWSAQALPAGTTLVRELGGIRYVGRQETFTAPMPEPTELRVLVAIDTSHHVQFLRQIRHQLWLGILLAAVLAAGLGWFASYKGLAPLRRVTLAASGLSAGRLGERLPEGDAPAEMLQLLRAFNGMLDRLEAAFRRLSDFSADIAHELRTPVSNLMTETQVALSRARSAEDYRETLHSNLEEFERLARMIGDMLFLAKADNGLLPRPAEAVALEAEAQALMEFYEALAEEKRVTLRLTGAATVVGDRLMLRRALSNLLSNALRHTPAGGTVEIRIAVVAGGITRLSVRNPGPTIPPDRLPLLFDRFHRIDPSRSAQGGGAGLGLAITRSIIEAHGGRIDAESAEGITTFSIDLPPGR